jgi:hypothetical protein
MKDITINGPYGFGLIWPKGEAQWAMAMKAGALENTPYSKIKKLEFEVAGEDAKGPQPRPCPLYKVTVTLEGKNKKKVVGIVDLGNIWGHPFKGKGDWNLSFCANRSAWRELRSIEFNEHPGLPKHNKSEDTH